MRFQFPANLLASAFNSRTAEDRARATQSADKMLNRNRSALGPPVWRKPCSWDPTPNWTHQQVSAAQFAKINRVCALTSNNNRTTFYPIRL